MTTWVLRTVVVTAANVQVMRDYATGLAESGQFMWNTPLSATGANPATHYISSGMISVEAAAYLKSPSKMAQTTGLTNQQCVVILNSDDDSNEKADFALNRLGLKLIHTDVT